MRLLLIIIIISPLSLTHCNKLPSGINFWEINLFMEILMTRTVEATPMSLILILKKPLQLVSIFCSSAVLCIRIYEVTIAMLPQPCQLRMEENIYYMIDSFKKFIQGLRWCIHCLSVVNYY